MAINFTISYTFSPSTTISSSQVNTNFSDNAAVWQGLEALTKSFAKLKVDVDPSTALEVVTKQYADHYNAYRRPNLVFASVSTVSVEPGLDGTSGDIPILFPDGSLRIETSTTRTTFNITRNAVLTTAGAQSGLTGATSEAANTWYALYAVKVTDSSTLWVTVGSTVLPLQANFSTLNTAYGTNGWVYLGMIRNGDNSGATSDILSFTQVGHLTLFTNLATGTTISSNGIREATSAGATSITWSTSFGTTNTDVPNHLGMGFITAFAAGGGSGTTSIRDGATNTRFYFRSDGTAAAGGQAWIPLITGGQIINGSSIAMDLYLSGFADGVLGIGANPIL